jgi:hypothetical protein
MPFTDLQDLMANPPSVHLDKRCALWEIHCPPRICPVVRRLGGQARRSIDLNTFWDLSKPEMQHSLTHDLYNLRPFCTFLCPPCTYLSQLMFSNWGRMDPIQKDANLCDALAQIDVAMWVAQFQRDSGLIGFLILLHV